MGEILLFRLLKSNGKLFLALSFFIFTGQSLYAKTLYVNDSSTNGDKYTKAVGNDANDGLSINTPKLTLVAAYKTAVDGDVIYVDVGKYDERDFVSFSAINPKKVQIIRAETNSQIFEKTPLPTEQKNTPEVFYIINDKPVTREEYLHHLEYSSRKK